MAALEAGRGCGRNDYPVSAMRRAPIAGVVFQHASIRSLLRELGRNPALLELCGFEALPFRGAPLTELRAGTQGPPCAVTHPARVRSTVPSHWNFSRFLTGVVQLEKEQGPVSAMIESLRSSLFEEVPDFGRHPGCDGKAIESHSTGRVAEGKKDASDPDADWGKHETSGVNARTGKVWKKVKSWFGYRTEGIELRAGDRIRWTRNDAGLGLVNSRTAEVLSVANGRVGDHLEARIFDHHPRFGVVGGWWP